ncbi:probable malonyl-CoA-acyl carrier protein transacylase, mitochondrial [Ischnura elegans]|uniref:probable malonyl-CoA-acyl carrier protein transacylase, mitochondrial n=1 Tax=Ischnura elegans TaxID=197161 RepID=UPI001ED884F9|nr:probable malonyl-CoA-acyl carrier protein transacylase, mitochondrial [Ischnura elegans]
MINSFRIANSHCLHVNCFKTLCHRSVCSRVPKEKNARRTASESDSEVTPLASRAKELLEDSVVAIEPKPQSPDDVWVSDAYPKSEKRIQSRHLLVPKVDPRETSLILFPGQGAQSVGMGKELLKFPIVKELFDCAGEILGFDLKKLCLEGPKEELDKTEYCQPAILVCSLAALEKLKEERPSAVENCVATAGFSVGEIAALVFSGSLAFENAVNLVKVRAKAMQLASDLVDGGMMTVMYGPDSNIGYACLKARQWCEEKGIEKPECRVANYLYPHCKVIAGNIQALQYIEENARALKLKRVKRLPVSGAFHTELMRPAVEPFQVALRKAKVSDPIISVHSNVDGKRYKNAKHILMQLPKQIYKPVKWEQTLHILYERPDGEHFPKTYECGPGSSLKTILKMVNAKAWNSCTSIS